MSTSTSLAGPPGATVRHLLAHASGLPFEGETPIAAPGRRRIYSNEGFRVLAEHVAARAEMPFADYVRGAVADPLGTGLRTTGHPGAGMQGSLDDLLALGRELLGPTIVAPETLAEAATVQFPGLDGVVPGIGRRSPNDWGLGFDLHDAKDPYWMGVRCSPQTFGHFGGTRDVPLGRPRRGGRVRSPDRPRVRRLGARRPGRGSRTPS